MIKVIASDMDGTLLGGDHKIAPETLDAIHRAQGSGIRFILATGRNFQGTVSALDGLDLTCDYLVSSGAEVRNQEQQVVSRIDMDLDICEDIYELLKSYPVTLIFSTDWYEYQIGTYEEVERNSLAHMKLFFLNLTDEEIRQNELYRSMEEKTKVIPDFDTLRKENVPIYKIMFILDDTEKIARMKGALENNPEIAVASSFPNNLEITNVRAQKGLVLKEYIESLGYTMDEVMVFGDSMNDYSMLSMDFGATIAMDNAEPEIKAAAKHITKSNEELGVAYAINELLKRQPSVK